MLIASVRKQAEQFIAEQGFLLRSDLTSKEAVAAALLALPDEVGSEVIRLMEARSSGTSTRRPKRTGYLREERTARSSGAKTALYDADHPDSLIPSADGGRWAAVCETHGCLLQDEKYETARWALSHPEEFCEVCQARIGARERIADGDTRPAWEIVRELLGPNHGFSPQGPDDKW